METQANVAPKLSNADRIEALEAAVQALSTFAAETASKLAILEARTAPKEVHTTEMTDDHARSVTYGDLAGLKHKEAAEKLGLTYGQIYSCRLGFTFKHVHKEAKAAGKPNAWIK